MRKHDSAPFTIEDLTPFCNDGCWMFVLLAKTARVGVILRRGPTDWWQVTRWDTRTDEFEKGQWFHGRIYPNRCDLSPNGRLLIYFAAKFGRRCDYDYSDSWTAVSRPPYLTALALWPVGGAWGGQAIFVDDFTVETGTGLPAHPDHPPGPLLVVQKSGAVPCWQVGWQPVPFPTRFGQWRKSCGDLALGRDLPEHYPSRTQTVYYLYSEAPEPIAQFEAHWADWDQNGRLVAAVGGHILAARLTRNDTLRWRQLADLQNEKPAPLEPPEWARRW